MSTRQAPSTGTLARLGYIDAARARQLFADPALAGLSDPLDDVFEDGLAEALARVADPDLALLALVRLMEAARRHYDTSRDDEAHANLGGLVAAAHQPGVARDRLFAVLGGSRALGDHLVAHPDQWRAVTGAEPMSVEERIDSLVSCVTEAGASSPDDALRIGYRRHLLGIAALDLTAPDPLEVLPATAAALADLAQAALEAALAIAVSQEPHADRARLAVIGMGKTGGRELNYISDVDVIFVAEPAEGVAEEAALAVATRVATRLMRACSRATAQGALWQVDPNLRPEGKNGPLVRTVASHGQYYQRWASTWEFQALLKARHVAGDTDVSRAYLDLVTPLVWQAASRPNFVEDAQAMRRRVEEHVPSAQAGQQLKLGPGGLRDVEFSIQLLQLVHGRTDESLRSPRTLDALAALSTGGYVGRADAAVLDTAYRLLRVLEHRLQVFALRRTHLMPTAEADLRRLGRAVGHRVDPATQVQQQWRQQARQVRRIHERLFYRPLLAAAARLSSDEASLSRDAARDRLAALGFTDPAGAMRHLEALTSGVSRRAAIQRTLLPVMLSWFADEADPDGGLLAFRKISDELGATHWYLRLLRDEGTAAERLARVLGRSRYAADLLLAAPEAVQILGDMGELVPRERDDLVRRMDLAAGRKDDLGKAVSAIRTIRRSELFRIAVADLTGCLDQRRVGRALADLTDAVLHSTLVACVTDHERAQERGLGTRLLVVGMGSLGGRETGYVSDADVMLVHDPDPGVDDQQAQADALSVFKTWLAHLGASGPAGPIQVDTDLRPEGRNGPMVRTLAAYRTYYQRWSLVWETQALVRARPVAGDEALGARFCELIDPIRWPADGLSAEQVVQIRRLKARMEAERLPRGADRRTHFKLGSGGLSDVEWTVQLLQLQHAHTVPGLRTTSTLDALAAAHEAGLIGQREAHSLRDSWLLAARARSAGLLARGRAIDSVPSNWREADGVARIMGYPPQSGQELAEDYRRASRRARATFMRDFFGADP